MLFSKTMAEIKQSYPQRIPEVMEARKRVVFKRFLRQSNVLFDPAWPTLYLKTMYFAIKTGYIVQNEGHQIVPLIVR